MATASLLTCLCGGIEEHATILADQSLPNDNYMCHCDTCRRTTGALGTSYLNLKGSPSGKSLSNATAFSTSKSYTRFFCSRCGCNVFVRCEIDGSWQCCSGIVELNHDGQCERNVSRLTYHEYVRDAKDGGLAPFLRQLGGRTVPCYIARPQDDTNKVIEEKALQQLQETSVRQAPSISNDRGDRLDIVCQCGACQFYIVPPSYDEYSEGWYVPKQDHSKYYARFCCCRSCRLTMGFSLQPWTYVPPSQIFTSKGEAVVFGPRSKEVVQVDRLKHYQSSDAVLRSLCAVCGATIFYQSFERPYIIDVSVGVLKSKMGNAMAGEWLEWDRDVVSKRGEAVDEEMVDAWLRK